MYSCIQQSSLTQVAAITGYACRPTSEICTGGYITLKDGQTLEYDWLVLALGAETASFGIPGVRELALPFCTYDDAVRVRRNIACLEGLLHTVSGPPSLDRFKLTPIQLRLGAGCYRVFFSRLFGEGVGQWRSVAIRASALLQALSVAEWAVGGYALQEIIRSHT